MADYGAPSFGIGSPQGLGTSVPNQPAPQPQDQGHPFDEESLGKAFQQIGSQQQQPDTNDVQKLQAATAGGANKSQWSGVNAIGTPGQIAQASIGRNVNERLQIWSKLVGDSNAMIGPPINGENDVWIRGPEGKFHPADTGHTDFMQSLAKKTGAGIDVVTQGIAALAGGVAGTAMGAAPVGAAIGYAAGPGLSSAGRQFLESRLYGVKPDVNQFKRDLYIGGAMNLAMGGIMSGMGNISSNVADSISEGPQARMSKIADAQLKAKNFMDVVGARPSEIITENGIESPMSKAGEVLYSATQLKRRQMNDLIGSANDLIVSSSPEKVDTKGLSMAVQDFMKKDGFQFTEDGSPVPYQRIPTNAQEVGGNPMMVEASRLNRPQMGTEAMNDLAKDYEVLRSGQMDAKSFLQLIRDWQENSKFKPLDERSDATRSGWADLQHMATVLRNNEIQKRFSGDPEMSSAIQNAYHEYTSSRDAINMIYDAYKSNQNSPELLAKIFTQPGKKELLSQAKSLFADRPDVMKGVRSAWLSEKMGNHVGSDGIFNANNFVKDLRGTGGETLSQLFKPEEIGSIYRASKIMGNVKSSDLISQEQGQNVAEAVADLAKASSSASFAKPWAIVKWLQNKPKMADYLSSPDGLTKIASQEEPTAAKALYDISSLLKSKLSQAAATTAIRQTQIGKSFNPLKMPVTPLPKQEDTGTDAAAQNLFSGGQ